MGKDTTLGIKLSSTTKEESGKCVRTHTHIHAITSSGKKRGHEFEGEWGGVCGRDWREERQQNGRNLVINL